MAYGSDMSFPFYTDLDGSALQGSIWFGVAGQNPVTNPVSVFWDSAATQPAAQPITISKGRTVRSDGTPCRVWVASDFSALVQNKLGAQVVFEPNQPVTIAALNAINQATAQVALATTQVGIATTQAGVATTQAGIATTQAGVAQGYAAAAATNAKFFDTIALGNAGVADGVTFGVKAGGSDGLTRPTVYRRESVGVSTALYSVLPASEYDAFFPVLSGLAPVWAVMDDKGNTALEVDSAGNTAVAALKTPTVNGFSVRSSLRPSNAGTFNAELLYVNNTGQSLSSGQILAITTAQEYDNLGYPFWASSPAATVPLTAANCAQLSAGGFPCEPPLFGALYYIKKLLEEENGLAYTAQKFQLVGCDNSHGSYSITALNKGNTLYAGAITQALSTKTIADAGNLIGAVAATLWTQGEADTAMTIAAYQALFSQLATDYNTDYKAQTGQTWDVPFISYQTGSTAGSTVAQAQLAASLANPLIRIACAMGVFDYQDNLHIDSESTKWLGCYYGLVMKRVLVDGLTWSPLRPLAVAAGGVGKKWVNVRFNTPVKPLVIDTTQIPAQSQSGFTTVTSGGVDIPITAITVVAPDTVKFEYGSALPVGAKWRSGFLAATGKGPYVGAAVNLRDSQGDSVPLYESRRLDNWCVISELAL